MRDCHWFQKYTADLERARKEKQDYMPLYGPNGALPNYAAEAEARALSNLHKLSLDHRLGGCACQARPATARELAKWQGRKK